MPYQIKLRPAALSAYYTGEKISRDELSRRMGVASTTAFRVEKGVISPSARFVAGLISVSGKRFEHFFEIVPTEDAA